MAGEMGKWEDFLTCVVTSEGLEKGSHREGELPTRCTSDRQTAAGKWQRNVCTEDGWRGRRRQAVGAGAAAEREGSLGFY